MRIEETKAEEASPLPTEPAAKEAWADQE